MDENIREALGNEVLAQLLTLDRLEMGSEEKTRAIDGVCKLYKLGLEESKQDNDTEIRFAELNNEVVTESRSKVREWAKIGLEGAAIIIPALISISFMKMGLDFEKTGTFTSGTFKNVFGLFRPKK